MPRALARAPVLGQFDGARVVDVPRRGEALLEPNFREEVVKVDNFRGGVLCGDDLGLCGRERDAVLPLRPVRNRRAPE
eukprot:5299344-Pleurochrysis_carterae.AAC.1